MVGLGLSSSPLHFITVFCNHTIHNHKHPSEASHQGQGWEGAWEAGSVRGGCWGALMGASGAKRCGET